VDARVFQAQQWFDTVVVIGTQPVTIDISGFSLRNSGRNTCGDIGCNPRAPRISPSLVDSWNHMTVIGRVGDGPYFLIGPGTTINPAETGSGRLQLSVNRYLPAGELEGGFYFKVE
jgi:hypothetical protein